MGILVFNWIGLLGAAVALGVGFAGMKVLQDGSTFVALLWFFQSAAFICWLFALLYDRPLGPNILQGYSDCMKGFVGSPRKYSGRFAVCGVPLIGMPIALLLAFLFFWVVGLLISATSKQCITFLAATLALVALTTTITLAVDQHRRGWPSFSG